MRSLGETSVVTSRSHGLHRSGLRRWGQAGLEANLESGAPVMRRKCFQVGTLYSLGWWVFHTQRGRGSLYSQDSGTEGSLPSPRNPGSQPHLSSQPSRGWPDTSGRLPASSQCGL